MTVQPEPESEPESDNGSSMNPEPPPSGDPPWEPPLAGTDAEHLVASLDRMRATVTWKAEGLTDAQLRRTIGVSNLSIGGLLKHLAVVEDEMFGWKFHGEAPETLLRFRSGHEHDDDDLWMFTFADHDNATEIYQVWAEAHARARKRIQRVIDEGGFDRLAHLSWGNQRPSFRRLMHDAIEEYSRHAGHIDLLRESIDGRVGEDPPREWVIPLP